MQPQAQVPQSYIIEGYHTRSLSLVIYIAKQTKQHYNRKRTQEKEGGAIAIRRKTFKEVKAKKSCSFPFC